MPRRKETRTKTVTVTVRAEFTAADLRKRLRLPQDAVLAVYDPDGLAKGEASLNDLGLVATFTRTPKPRERSA